VFTQIGLTNIWNELKTGRVMFSGDAQIVCNTVTDRCMKIYLHEEGRYLYFSSKRQRSPTNRELTIWVSSENWEP